MTTPKKVIIIGAARSGTNMLRDLITSIPGFETWPCDEINYIWRYGVRDCSHDELDPDLLTNHSLKYIRSRFDWLEKRYSASTIVEKTCANSLRVEYVDRIVPDARYIFVVRDGRDVVASAMKRWKAPLDIPYLLAKARFVPKSDLFYYATKYGKNRIYKFFSKNSRLAFWGPCYSGMNEDLERMPLHEIAAMQWMHCVKRSSAALSNFGEEKYIKVKYEDFVANPIMEFEKIAEFIGSSLSINEVTGIVSKVKNSSVGNWRYQFDDIQMKKLNHIMGDLLCSNEYEV